MTANLALRWTLLIGAPISTVGFLGAWMWGTR